jgi:LCP family protein required for cell wall assembly
VWTRPACRAARRQNPLHDRLVEEITGLPIDYYLTMNFSGFRRIIDVLGGVEMDIPFDMDYDDPEQDLHIHLRKGKQMLDGLKSEQFVRYRKGNHKGEGYRDGDIGRIQAQQEFIRAFIEQKLKIKYILKTDEIFYILKNSLKTNIEVGDLNYLLKSMKNINIEEVNTYTLPGNSDYINKQWYYIYDKKETKELIDDSFYK